MSTPASQPTVARRLHLVEIEDLPWLPDMLRDMVTDVLRAAMRIGAPYREAGRIVSRMFRPGSTPQIVDLCSGGGGPAVQLVNELRRTIPEASLTLTDRFPNVCALKRAAQHPGIKAILTPIDARALPESLRGVRTMFTSFHHFPPQEAQALLLDAVTRGDGIAVFEPTGRSLRNVIAVLGVLLLTIIGAPFLRPFSLYRLVFTWLIPIVPLIVVWDGMVSNLRTYSRDQVKALLHGLPVKYRFEYGTLKNAFTRVSYFCVQAEEPSCSE